ncbi:MAG TPA: N,N-dimethylformamidase beta subunit family domain-containing protein [Solirubrobacterales bacterium]|nr:N,N-dimethylformamidase beta subunit family domain-containing protein [Solirubrobacterales bacterium]
MLATRAAAPGSIDSAFARTQLRITLCCLALALGLLLVAPATGSANPITDENALAGSSGWERGQADAPNIEGYTSKTSVAPGEGINFFVSTKPTASYRIVIYRLGWYNSAGARQVACLPSCTGTYAGVSRSTPDPNAQTGKIDAGWTSQLPSPFTIPANWTSGEYVAEYVLTSGSQSGSARYSPFVVRSNAPQASASNILVVVPFNTYLAYNNWGGTSAYENDTNKHIFGLDHATKVSFNRPFARREWRFWDLPLLRFLEREGYDVSYVSDTDVDANPSILTQHRSVVVSGHSEYWTKNMRDGFDAARDQGTNLMFAGANDAYWQVRYEDSTCPSDNTVCSSPGVGDRRTMVIYKGPNEGPEDPYPGTANDTSKFRELGRPECELQGGVQYGSYFTNDGYRNYTTTAEGAADPWAVGTGLGTGSTVAGLVGFEYDSFFPDCQPPGVPKVLFKYQGPETSADLDAAAVRYTANGSGARVFSSGTEQWAWGLDSYRWDPTLFTGIPATNTAVQQFTRNMLADMAKPAAPAAVSATESGGSILIDTTSRTDPRITSYKIYRHSGTADFKPGDPGVTLVCQNASGDCADSPTTGTYRYASVAVDQWNDSAAALSGPVTLSAATAVNDSATVTEDAAATSIDVLSNDTDSGGNPITINSGTQPAHGTVVLTGGTAGARTGLTYQPNADYCNNPPGTSPDTFTYTLNGGSTGTVSVTVNCVDDPPAAVRDPVSLTEDDPATAIDVLANDTDIDGGPKTVGSVTQPAHGTVVRNSDGSGLTYQPNANYCNFPGGAPTDDFTYTLNGGSTATVAMTVDCVDDPPGAATDTASVTEDSGATAIDVLANDTDVDGGPRTVGSVTQPAHGTVVRNSDGSGLTYLPNADYCNNPPGTSPDTFTYTLNGGSTGTVSVTVNCVDDPPAANDDSTTVSVNDGATAIAVLSNDVDVEHDPITITSAGPAAHGTVTVDADQKGLTYELSAGYCESPPADPSDSFTYTVNGGAWATVTVRIDCTNPPTAVDDAAAVPQDAPATAIDVRGNDPNADGGPKLIMSTGQPGHGAVAITDGGLFLTYKPAAGYCNSTSGVTDNFTYTLNGGSTASVLMTVTCPQAPQVVPTSQATPQTKTKKCKKGFKRVKGKCRKKRKRKK